MSLFVILVSCYFILGSASMDTCTTDNIRTSEQSRAAGGFVDPSVDPWQNEYQTFIGTNTIKCETDPDNRDNKICPLHLSQPCKLLLKAFPPVDVTSTVIVPASAQTFSCVDRISQNGYVLMTEMSPYDFHSPTIVDLDRYGLAPSFFLRDTCCITASGSCPPNVGPQPIMYNWVSAMEPFGSTNYVLSCLACKKVDAGARTCSDGQYATTYLTVKNGWVIPPGPKCIPCKPGTWMTCITAASCSWNIPASESEMLGSTEVYVMGGHFPIGTCYPCETAGNKVHYDLAPSKKSVINTYGAQTSMLWYCPGNENGMDGVPRKCDAVYWGASTDGSRCICSPGHYEPNPKNCTPCPVGHYCVAGELRECPDHSYQDKTAQTSCVFCTAGGMPDTTPVKPCSGMNLARQCVDQYKKVPPGCSPCNQCENPYTQGQAGLVKCYH